MIVNKYSNILKTILKTFFLELLLDFLESLLCFCISDIISPL